MSIGIYAPVRQAVQVPASTMEKETALQLKTALMDGQHEIPHILERSQNLSYNE